MNLRGCMTSKEHGHQTLFSLQQDAVKDHREISREAAAVHKLIYGVPKVVNGKRRLRCALNVLGEEVNTRAKAGERGKNLAWANNSTNTLQCFSQACCITDIPFYWLPSCNKPTFHDKLRIQIDLIQ